jgi:hypothetical protein
LLHGTVSPAAIPSEINIRRPGVKCYLLWVQMLWSSVPSHMGVFVHLQM